MGSKTTWIGLLITMILAVAAATATSGPQAQEEKAPQVVRINVKPLPDGIGKVALITSPNGRRHFVLTRIDGTVERLDAEAFAERLAQTQSGKPWFFRLLNISSSVGIAWVLIGLLGQILFTGRMLIQWLVSEKAKRSVVPVAFWWMSLVGATMLLTYFIWRRDIVGVLGQSAGWFIYVRNLWLIYKPASATEAAES